MTQQEAAHPEGGPSDSRLMENRKDISRVGSDSRLVHTQELSVTQVIAIPPGKGGEERLESRRGVVQVSKTSRSCSQVELNNSQRAEHDSVFLRSGSLDLVSGCAFRLVNSGFPRSSDHRVCGWAQVFCPQYSSLVKRTCAGRG